MNLVEDFCKVLDSWEGYDNKALAERLAKIAIGHAAKQLEASLGECAEGNQYEVKPEGGLFWLEHKHVGSSEPLFQWIRDVMEK